jgi:hypothetical protein
MQKFHKKFFNWNASSPTWLYGVNLGWTIKVQRMVKQQTRPNNNQKDVLQHMCNNFETIIDK